MSMHPHSSEDEWTEVQKAALREKSVADGVRVIDDYLRATPSVAFKRQALGFRGSLHEEHGDLAAARADFLAARELAEEADFERYTLEGSAAAVSQQLGQLDEAEQWCLEALKTAAADPTTSGASALLRLLGLRGQRGLRNEEQPLIERVVYQAWHLLRVEGEPDLEDLEGTARKLIDAQRGPFSADRPPAPKAYPGPTE